MDKEGKTMKYRNILKKRILAGLLAGAAACAAAPALAASGVVPNTQLPQGGNFVAGGGTIGAPSNGQMTITQNTQNGVIKWDSFNVGANATVNFEKGESYNGGDRFNTLNYVNQANGMSQIYGAISAAEGNIYIVNPAGVEISNSAQINVGSLYVSNRNMTDDVLKGVNDSTDITKLIQSQAMNENPDAVLMSLGNINATNVTFEGNRIVIDTERIKDESGDIKLVDIDNGQNITIRTTNENNVVIGYKGYDEDNNAYNTQDVSYNVTKINDDGSTTAKTVKGYMWVEDVEQLQAIGASADTLDGNYALRNSIDATATKEWNSGAGFNSIGTKDKAFTGKFDGLDYNIFNLNINRGTEENVGLFGVVGEGAVINNVTLVGGSITGQNNVGALAGSVQGGAHISNITNSASVTGEKNVGGIVGESIGNDSQKTVYENLINTGTITSSGMEDGEGGRISNAGGLIGYLEKGDLGGTSYNLGAVTGRTENDGPMIVGYNVGGLVGHAVNSVIGNEDMIDEGGNVIAEGTTVYNRLNVTGAYNVGGIVGNMEGTTVRNAENSGTVKANGYTKEVYSYHTGDDTYDTMGGSAVDGKGEVEVYVANAGGIAGTSSALKDKDSTITSTISDVLNLGDVSSNIEDGSKYYDAGNVAGVVGRAEDTDLSNATNRESNIRGAHNVGGVAGYFGGEGNISNAINDGSDVMATGARAAADSKYNVTMRDTYPGSDSYLYGGNVYDGFAYEHVRPGTTGKESAIIGNMGGIVGYMDGDDVYITSSANRGSVHTESFSGINPPNYAMAANAGGIVGKIDRSSTEDISALKENYANAAVSDSYNTGDVRGYINVGGIAGMMYNGEIADAYNEGRINTTRQPAHSGDTGYDAANIGGIVGDTTENISGVGVTLYDVYNKGQIGDESFTYYGRHFGGIVGRLSGTVKKAYNTGAIYNAYCAVGGIAGWMADGTIENAFNTGNITVLNRDSSTSEVGGIVGAVNGLNAITINNVYNLGTLRSFQANSSAGKNAIAGIVGGINGRKENQYVTITNAYTTGNIYAGVNNYGAGYVFDRYNSYVGSIYGEYRGGGSPSVNIKNENTYYIQPGTNSFADLVGVGKNNAKGVVAFNDRDKKNAYSYTENGITHSLNFTTQNLGDVDGGESASADDTNWRIYEGTTPILNAFLPNAEEYFAEQKEGLHDEDGNLIYKVQYGTAYDPLLTIITAGSEVNNLTFDWGKLDISDDAGLAVYGADLNLNDFKSNEGIVYFSGLIYSDGALSLSGEDNNDILLGSASQLYGSSVAIDADGQVTIYGSVTATGNGTTESDDPDKFGSISITGGSVDIYGQLTSADAKKPPVFVPGIDGMDTSTEWNPGQVNQPNEAMSDIGNRFGHTTGQSNVTGNISITANDAEDGHVNVYYGNKGEGLVTTGGSLEVTASGDIYMDSDLSIGGNLTLNAGQIKDSDGNPVTAVNSEAVLDISNIGKVQAANGTVKDALTGLHAFLDNFVQEGKNITLKGDETKLAVDMWGDGAFDLTKYDLPGEVEATLADKLDRLHINGEIGKGKHYTYIWVSTGEQLAGIQEYYNDPENKETQILSYNFALKNDIDASDVTDYEAIGTGAENGYTGTFDGRDNRIIGLDTTKTSNGSSQTLTNAGIFDTIGISKNADGTEQVGTVEDLRVYSGTFSGTDNAGAVAGVNNGSISNVTTFGNVVESANHAGGIAGENNGTISGASAIGTSTVTADKSGGVAGGIAGTNTGKISNSSTNSAVDSSSGGAAALGGAAGVNRGTLENVDSLGVTTGIYKVQTGGTLHAEYSDNVGGIAGTNSGEISNAYNESIVSGRDNVGGIIGTNEAGTTVENVSNAASVTGEAGTNDTSDYVGGLVGDNKGSITNGRNNGEITGNRYVGGLVGENGKDSTLSNLVNDEAASITGDEYVGGIAGRNYGTISANDEQLVNRGSITGQMYVGGVAGSNEAGGTITNTISSIALHVKTDAKDVAEGGDLPQYFGGVVGQNSGIIKGATNESSVDVAADGASMVGGIIGENTGTGKLEGTIANEGFVSGKSDVGGIIGSNQNTEILNNDDKNDRLVVSNSGLVQAEDGGAAGIFYNNTGAINNADLTNTGMVIGGKDAASITGGLFGTNSGDITNSTLTNNGTVYGGGTVGGLIGENQGKISHSSLINSVDGKVIGLNNVGGLIGQNYGTITGGRTEEGGMDVGYYKYQIYNNGTIQVGTWNDSDKDGIIDTDEFKPAAGENIGGLAGLNGSTQMDDGTIKTGSITAAYNTGAIMAGGSTNVGGIAGTNEGTLDQVFNTVMDADGTAGNITGSTNVGGIAGTNSGTIFNAYNTSDVYGDADSTGSIAGKNDSIISNVYATEKGQPVAEKDLVGNGNEAAHVYNSKDGFSEDGSKIDKDGQGTVADYPWRQYGDNNPILKVFLTQLTVNDVGDLVYNGYDQNLNLNELIGKGKNHITGPTGMENPFEAHYNTLKPNSSYGDSELLYNVGEQVNAGTYQNWLASEQISAGKDKTVNNLGYDIAYKDNTVGKVGKAQISITLDDINRTYGNSTITSSQAHDMGSDAVHVSNGTNDYGYSYTITNQTLTDKMKEQLSGITFDKDSIKDGAVEEVTGDRQTNDADSYTWKADFSLGTTTPSGTSLADNYEFVSNGQGTSSITVSDGNSTVGKATVTVTLDDVQHTYGDTKTSTDYHIKDNIVWANGDTYTNADVSLGNISDSAFDGETGHTNNAGGKYSWDADISGTGSHADKISQNYNFEVIQGSSVVKKKGITISLGEVSHEYGTPATDGYTFKADGWVYGQNYFTDNISIGSLGQGITDGALKDNNTHTQDVNQNGYTWTTNNAQIGGDGATNYYIKTVKDGTSKVTPVTVDISLGHVTHEYGTLNDQYGLNGNVAWANGDQYTNADVSLGNIKDEADLGNGKTNDVGDNYTWTADVTAGGSDAERIGKNYIFNVVNKGTSEVTPKQIVIVADDKEMYVGGTRPAFTGTNRTEISSQLANGDTLDSLGIKDYDYGPESAVDTTLGNSKYPIVFWYDNHSHSMTTEGLQDLFGGNYNVTFKPGTLTVLALPDGMPEISDIPSIERHWNFLFDDNPWDRNRDFRERKAEVHFVAGGMTL